MAKVNKPRPESYGWVGSVAGFMFGLILLAIIIMLANAHYIP